MSLKQIETELNARFADYNKSSSRNIIFWYDKEGQYADEIDSINLSHAKLQKLTKTNSLATKYLIEHEDTESNYLIYAAFDKPAVAENHLFDMYLYSRHFVTDRESAICEDCKISTVFLPFLKKFPQFWTDSNEKRFKEIIAVTDIVHLTEKQLGLIMLASVVKTETADFNQMVKILITSDFVDGKQRIYNNLVKFGLDELFWQYCAEEYGFNKDVKAFDKLIASLFITHCKSQIDEEFAASYKPYILSKMPNVVLLVSSIMNDMNSASIYSLLARKVEDGFKIPDLISKLNIDNLTDCFTFEVIDYKISEYLINKIINEADGLNHQYMSVLISRIKKTHFENYKLIYRTIDRASHLLNAIKTFEVELSGAYTIDDMINKYTESWCSIDRYYRQFYYALDNSSDHDKLDSVLEKLRVLVENSYTNKYLSSLYLIWRSKMLAISDYKELPGRKQWQFYEKVAKSSARNERTVVIISDAFRYECGKQLATELKKTAGYKVENDYMISTLPSYTQLGMAALLPNKNFKIDSKTYVSLDGKSTAGADARNTILTLPENQPNGLCIRFDAVFKKPRDTVRQLFAGKDLIYIYHDKVDTTGDDMNTENQVFDACQEAIDDIAKLIVQLTNGCSIGKYIVTADHGFIYKRDKIQESDKLSTGHIHAEDIKKRRFVLTQNKTIIDDTLRYSMGYLGESMADTEVVVPCGVDIFKASGGQNFVHGGAALQEIVIPLVTVETSRGKHQTQEVNIDLASVFRTISNLNTYIDFIQKEPVSDTLHPRTIRVWFEDANGNKVSNENIIVADRTNTNPDERKYQEKFIFASRKYSPKDKFFMRISDNETGIEISHYEYVIDIPFADDFGFEF